MNYDKEVKTLLESDREVGLKPITIIHANAIRRLSEAVITLAYAIEAGRIDGVLEEVASTLYEEDTEPPDVTKN